MPDEPFSLVFAPAIKAHLAAIEKKFHSLIRATIEQQLTLEPTQETRNRKRLRRPSVLGFRWELRFGPKNQFRVYYVVEEEERIVNVLAIGVKEGNVVSIGGEEVKL